MNTIKIRNNMNLKETLNDLSKPEILEMLRQDEHYYGEFGQQFLSNSDVKGLNGKIGDFRKPGDDSPNLLIGSVFHAMHLEPEKVADYPVFDSSTRKTKKYLKASEEAGKMLLLKKEFEMLEKLSESLDNLPFRYAGDKSLKDLIHEGEKEVPNYEVIFGEHFKGKADVLNHEAKIIIDLKTSSNVDGFPDSALKWGYDSQAYIYRELFGYEVVFLVFDKKTFRIGFFDCSPEFYASGREKVVEAIYSYKTNYKNEENKEFDLTKYLTYKTL